MADQTIERLLTKELIVGYTGSYMKVLCETDTRFYNKYKDILEEIRESMNLGLEDVEQWIYLADYLYSEHPKEITDLVREYLMKADPEDLNALDDIHDREIGS